MTDPAPMPAESGAGNIPPLDVQKGFWDQWNQTWRFRGLDSFMDRQREFALDVAQRLGVHDARILDVGCGTGWLGYSLRRFGQVCGTDLSEAAVAEGRRLHSDVTFVCGDFLTVDLQGPFDFVLSADSLINMYDQPASIARMAGLLKPGGVLLLMTPNIEIWRRRSALKPLGQGQVQHWRSIGQYTELLRPFFTIQTIATIAPGGDKGRLWWVENRYVRKGMSLLIGRTRWRNMLEKVGLGRELVFVARKA